MACLRRFTARWCCCSKCWRRGVSFLILTARSAPPGQGWCEGQMLLAVLVLNAVGLDRVVAAAHKRCGYGEEVNAVLKSEFAVGMMPSGRFGANAAWLWLSALALNAMALAHRAAYGHEWRWVRMKRIRAVWIHLVARVVRHGRQVTHALGAVGAHLVAARGRTNLAIPPSVPHAPG